MDKNNLGQRDDERIRNFNTRAVLIELSEKE